MSLLEYSNKILENTNNSITGHEMDMRFNIIDFINSNIIDMKKKDLADRLEMKPSQLSRILSGEENLTIRTIAKIYYVFGKKAVIKEFCDIEYNNIIPITEASSYKQSVTCEDNSLEFNPMGVAL